LPLWLASRMQTIGTAIVESVLHHYGRSGVLARLSDPFWFQALGSVMGLDWHSSGITTSVMGALKRGLNPARASSGSTSVVDAAATRGRRRRSSSRSRTGSGSMALPWCAPAA
jgi:uncharacterized protein